MTQWVGYMVSIKCGHNIGSYQGEIYEADQNKIVLTKAFCDGFPCDGPVQILASEIIDLKFIDKPVEDPQEISTVTIPKPVPKRIARSHSTSEASCSKQAQIAVPNRSKPIDIEISKNLEESLSFKNNTPNKRGNYELQQNRGYLKGTKSWSKSWKDEECFGSPLDHRIKGDFDFEKNLALFDKQAVWDELNSQKPDVVKNAENRKKYRHDENVIATQPTSTRQIIVPKADYEFVTDDGLIVPCISKSLRRKLYDAADKAGLSWDKRVELFGTAAAEIGIQLIGGGHRLNPNNLHQLPTVVVLCGPNRPGAAGINTARQLTSHGVRTIVFCVSLEASDIKSELSLYMLTRNRTVTAVSELPIKTDLIICALSDHSDSPKGYPALAEWVDKNKAPVMALDPPINGTPGICPKISLVPVLPLSQISNHGKLYLANLGFPVDIFNEAGIKYRSPFGPKNIIPLHPQE